MKDQYKTEQALIQELDSLRRRITELERSKSECKRLEEVLRESEERYRYLAKHAPIGIYEIDFAARKFLSVNDIMCQYTGYTREELLAMDPIQLFTEESQKSFVQRHAKIIAVEPVPDNIEYEIKRKNGSAFWVLLNNRYSYGPNNRILSTVIAHDITDRKKIEDELRLKQFTIDHAPDTIAWITQGGRFFNVNEAMCHSLGYTREELTSMTIFDVDPDFPEEALPRLWEKMKKEGSVAFETRHRRKDGSIFPVEIVGTIMVADGKEYHLGIARDITRRKRVQDELHRSEENFRRSLEDSPLGVRIVTEEGETIYANRAILDIYGYDNIEEFKTNPVVKRYTPESFAEYQIRREKRRRGNYLPSEYDISIVRKDGEVSHVHVFRKEVLWDGERQFQVLYNDITERKRAEEALHNSEERFRLFMDNSPAVSWIKDEQGRYVYISKTYENLHGIRSADWLGKTVFELWPQEVAVQFWTNDQVVLTAGHPIEVTETTPNPDGGLCYWWNFKIPLHDSSGKKYIGGIGVDITELKRSEAALHAANMYNRSLIEASLDPLVTIGQDGRITDVNVGTEALTGYTRAELIGRDFSDYFTEPEKAHAGHLQAFRKGSLRDYPLEIRHRDGHVTPVLYNASVYRNEAGEVMGVFAAARDITERKRTEEALKKSREQLRALAGRLQSVREEERKQIAREIHDEFGGALTGLKIDLSFMASSAPKSRDKTKRDSFLSKMLDMTKLIDKTIGTVRRIVTELRPSILDDFGLIASLEWQLEEFQKRTGIQGEFASTTAYIHMDEKLSIAVFRIFQECLTNVARHANATKVTATLYKEADSFVLKVEDNGKGISEDDIHSTKSVGLTGMRERALFLGGTVNFFGEPSKGTTVSVQFPLRS